MHTHSQVYIYSFFYIGEFLIHYNRHNRCPWGGMSDQAQVQEIELGAAILGFLGSGEQKWA